jgi:hypothetical protein
MSASQKRRSSGKILIENLSTTGNQHLYIWDKSEDSSRLSLYEQQTIHIIQKSCFPVSLFCPSSAPRLRWSVGISSSASVKIAMSRGRYTGHKPLTHPNFENEKKQDLGLVFFRPSGITLNFYNHLIMFFLADNTLSNNARL